MKTGEMSIGASIELDVRLNGKCINFKSTIAYIMNDSVLVHGIKVDNQTVGFSENCMVNFMYKDDGKLYIWDNVRISLVRFDSEVYHKIDVFGDGKPHNRREAYRLYIGENMPLYINTVSGPSAIDVLIKDLSESGVAFVTKEDLDIDRTFRLKIRDNKYIISLSGIIVRKEELSHLKAFLYGCKFNEKNNLLPKYIARKQGDQLKSKSRLHAASPSRNLIVR